MIYWAGWTVTLTVIAILITAFGDWEGQMAINFVISASIGYAVGWNERSQHDDH